jgi:hypothetical protein
VSPRFGMIVVELSALALETYERNATHKHAAHLLGDAAHFLAEGQPEHARISLRIAERVLGESPIALDVSALHGQLVEVLLSERQPAPLPASSFLRLRKTATEYDPSEHASHAARRIDLGYRGANLAEVLS